MDLLKQLCVECICNALPVAFPSPSVWIVHIVAFNISIKGTSQRISQAGIRQGAISQPQPEERLGHDIGITILHKKRKNL